MTPLYEIHVRRDAHTTTPITIPDYELPILQEVFGTENVRNADKLRVDEAGPGTAIASFRQSDDEYERLCVKYSQELVEQVYGKKGSKALEKAMTDFTAKPAPKSRQVAS